MRVLLVDDNTLHLLILRKIFEKSNDEVVVARNGKEALRFLEFDPKFQVILTDMMMPEMDGVELVHHVRESTAMQRIPVIGFTSGDIEYYRGKGGELFDALVPKPFDFQDLYFLAKSTAA